MLAVPSRRAPLVCLWLFLSALACEASIDGSECGLTQLDHLGNKDLGQTSEDGGKIVLYLLVKQISVELHTEVSTGIRPVRDHPDVIVVDAPW